MPIVYAFIAIASFILATVMVAYGIGLALLILTSWQTYAVLFCLGLAYRIHHALFRPPARH